MATFTADDSSLPTPRPGTNSSLYTSITAFARFEFEAGRGNDGTKILMVEWEDDDISRDKDGSWHVEWDGKATVLPADERTNDRTRRFYFMLPPGTTIPPTITLNFIPPKGVSKGAEKVQLNPLPAIFPPELGNTARTAGKKGVLHTIWAKKRLQVLEKEIKEEQEYNLEGIALEMALQEKKWIEEHFGLDNRPTKLALITEGQPNHPRAPSSALSPTTPGGSKLSEKLKGLKLGTTERDLAGKPGEYTYRTTRTLI